MTGEGGGEYRSVELVEVEGEGGGDYRLVELVAVAVRLTAGQTGSLRLVVSLAVELAADRT